MSKKEQLKKSLQQVGINLDHFSGGEELTSRLLERVRGGNNQHERHTHSNTHSNTHYSHNNHNNHGRAIQC